MGEVYRARDSRLDRDVAIKVLPELFAADPERLRRFEREAKALASLSHPHIAQIYEIANLPGNSGSQVAALVMELVDGEVRIMTGWFDELRKAREGSSPGPRKRLELVADRHAAERARA